VNIQRWIKRNLTGSFKTRSNNHKLSSKNNDPESELSRFSKVHATNASSIGHIKSQGKGTALYLSSGVPGVFTSWPNSKVIIEFNGDTVVYRNFQLELVEAARAAINRAKYPPLILYPSYTLTSPFNTQRVINTVKTKLLSVFKVAPRQTISAAVLPKVRTPLDQRGTGHRGS
jgi:hypothetical protein